MVFISDKLYPHKSTLQEIFGLCQQILGLASDLSLLNNDTNVYMIFCCSIFIQAHFRRPQFIYYITIIRGCCSS